MSEDKIKSFAEMAKQMGHIQEVSSETDKKPEEPLITVSAESVTGDTETNRGLVDPADQQEDYQEARKADRITAGRKKSEEKRREIEEMMDADKEIYHEYAREQAGEAKEVQKQYQGRKRSEELRDKIEAETDIEINKLTSDAEHDDVLELTEDQIVEDGPKPFSIDEIKKWGQEGGKNNASPREELNNSASEKKVKKSTEPTNSAASVAETNDPHDGWDSEAFEATLNIKQDEETIPSPYSNPVDAELAAKLKQNTESLAGKKPGTEAESITKSDDPHDKFDIVSEKEAPVTETRPAIPSEIYDSKEGQEYRVTLERLKAAPDLVHRTEGVYQDAYQAYMETKSKEGFWNKLKATPRRLLGLDPQANEAKWQKKAADSNRALHFAQAAEFKKRRFTETGEAMAAGAGLSPEEAHQKMDRYSALLARELTINTYQKRLALQESALLAAQENNKDGFVYRSLDAWNKWKYARIAVTGLGYAAIAGSTGGIAAAFTAAGAYGSRVGLGMGLGVAAGFGAKETWSRIGVKAAKERLQRIEGTVGNDFLDKEFAQTDAEVQRAVFGVKRAETQAKVAGMAAAAVVGGAVALGSHVALDNVPDEIDATKTPVNNGEKLDVTKQPVQSSVNDPMQSKVPGVESASDGPVENTSKQPDRIVGITPDTEEATDGSTTVEKQMADNSTNTEAKTDMFRPVPEKNLDQAPQSSVDTQMSPISQENNIPTPDAKPEAGGQVMYEVVRGDNAWNILEGKGPDANPLGGKSEVLKGMSQAERTVALDKLFDYSDQHPEFGKEVGALKSGGDLGKIWPGEQINVSMLDDKLRELLNTDDTTDHSNVNLPDLETKMTSVDPEAVTDVNELLVGDVLDLQDGVSANDPASMSQMESLGLDRDSLDDLAASLRDRGAEQLGGEMTVNELAQSSQSLTEQSQQHIESTTPSYGEYDTFADRSGEVNEASVTEPVNTEAVNQVVESIEAGTGNFLFNGRPDVGGTYDLVKDMKLPDIAGLSADPQLDAKLQEMGVSRDGWNRWTSMLEDSVKQLPANEGETLAQYVNRWANSRNA